MYMAIVFGMVSLGAALGPLFGRLIVSYSTWRWAFYTALRIGGLALVLLVCLPASSRSSTRTPPRAVPSSLRTASVKPLHSGIGQTSGGLTGIWMNQEINQHRACRWSPGLCASCRGVLAGL